EENTKKGIIIGTQDELKAYIDDLLKAQNSTEDGTPPEPQAISLYGHIGHKYNVFSVDHGPVDYEGACRELYYWYCRDQLNKWQDHVNNTCLPKPIHYRCPYNDKMYSSFVITPTEPCDGDLPDGLLDPGLTVIN